MPFEQSGPMEKGLYIVKTRGAGDLAGDGFGGFGFACAAVDNACGLDDVFRLRDFGMVAVEGPYISAAGNIVAVTIAVHKAYSE